MEIGVLPSYYSLFVVSGNLQWIFCAGGPPNWLSWAKESLRRGDETGSRLDVCAGCQWRM